MSVEKVLGQVATGATSEATLYTVPASTSAVGKSMFVCNRGNTSTTFRISVDVGGAGTEDKDYIYYDMTIAGNSTVPIKDICMTLAATDKVKVYAGNANLSFTLFGSERTV